MSYYHIVSIIDDGLQQLVAPFESRVHRDFPPDTNLEVSKLVGMRNLVIPEMEYNKADDNHSH